MSEFGRIGSKADRFGRVIGEVFVPLERGVMIDDGCGTPFVVSRSSAERRWQERLEQGWERKDERWRPL